MTRAEMEEIVAYFKAVEALDPMCKQERACDLALRDANERGEFQVLALQRDESLLDARCTACGGRLFPNVAPVTELTMADGSKIPIADFESEPGT